MTRSKKVNETTTLAILKNVKTPPSTPSSGVGAGPPTPAPAPAPAPAPPAPATEEAKENKKHDNKSSPELKGSAKAAAEADKTGASRYNIFPRGDRANLPCAQYKTDKGYRCPNCMRCYNARKNLVRHVTLECGREPQYKCPHCAYSKHRRNELKKHIEKKHPEHHAPEKWTATAATAAIVATASALPTVRASLIWTELYLILRFYICLVYLCTAKIDIRYFLNY